MVPLPKKRTMPSHASGISNLEQRLETLEHQLGVLNDLMQKLASREDVFTDAERDGLQTLHDSVTSDIGHIQEKSSHRDTVVNVHVQTVEAAITTRESLLNDSGTRWPELFDIFRAEHMRLLQQREDLQEEHG